MSSQKQRPFAMAFALMSGLGGALVAASAAAQAEPGASAAPAQPPARPEPTHLETVVVTGSNLPTTPDAVAVPVTTLDAGQLQQNGVTSNPLEVLRKAIPSFAGRSNAGSSNANNNNQNTAGGSQLQLRNLPTLVLINGRRAATSAVGAVNGKNFVDVNQIPAAAIDHVDVLTDGASSIYGSDAIGGVVNFVLKSNYQGLETGGRLAGADSYGERSAYVLGGMGWGGGQFTAVGSFSQTDPLYQDKRSFTSPLYGKTSAIPGVVASSSTSPTAFLAPGLFSPSQTNPTGTAATATSINDLIANGTYLKTTPAAIAGGFDVSPYQQLLLKQEQDSFYANVSQRIFGKKLEFFGDALVSRSKSSTKFLPVAMTGLTVLEDAPYNPVDAKLPGVTFADLDKPHQFLNSVTAWRVTAGLRGEISRDWTWETGLVYSQSDLQQHQTNLIFKPNMTLAYAGGYDAQGNAVAGGAYSLVYGGFSKAGAPSVLQPALDPFARSAGLSPAMLANLYGTETIDATSRLTAFDAKLVGTLAELPAGKVGVAVGGGVRREELSGHTDPNGRVTDPVTGSTSATAGTDQEWQGGTFADPFSKGRSIDSLFTEVRVPITGSKWNVIGLHAFDLIAAVRAEKYSDAGYSTVPKVGFRWQPIDKQFTMRGTYARSFTAPTLYAEYGPTDRRQVGPAVIQGVFGPSYAAMPFNGEDGNNPNLQPAKSTSRTIGFSFKPKVVPGLSVALDYSDIALSGFQGGIGFNNILTSVNTLGSASPFFNNLSITAYPGDSGATNPFVNPGDLKAYLTKNGVGDPNAANNLYAVDQFRNLGSLIERSFALSAEYVIPTDRYGTFTLATTGADFRSFQFKSLPNQTSQELAGFATNSGVFGGTLPKYRFFNSLDWNYHNWDATLGNTYVSSVSDIGPTGTAPPVHVESYVTFDMRLAHDWHFDDLHYLRTVTLALGVNNVTDQMPPLAPQAFSDNNADVATYSPIGRLVYATAVLKF